MLKIEFTAHSLAEVRAVEAFIRNLREAEEAEQAQMEVRIAQEGAGYDYGLHTRDLGVGIEVEFDGDEAVGFRE